MRAAALCLSIAMLGCGCSRLPVWYPPPAQFQLSSGPSTLPEIRKVAMNDADASYSVSEGIPDIGRPTEYKWTADRFRFHLIAADLAKTDLYIHYVMAERTMRDTGPVTITVSVDGQAFCSFVESSPGEHISKYPADALTSKDARALDVTVTVHPSWTSEDGSKLGMLLESIGFAPRP